MNREQNYGMMRLNEGILIAVQPAHPTTPLEVRMSLKKRFSIHATFGTSFGIAALSATLAASLLTGCFGDDSVSSGDDKVTQTRTTVANDSLNQVMAHMMGGDYEYGKEDLTTLNQAHAAYQQALQNNPNHNPALFGSALTEVMLAVQDPKVANLINRGVEAPSPLDPRLAETSQAMRVVVMKRAANLAETFPEFHEVQDALAEEVLPALESATAKITRVYNDPNFSLKLTVDGETREIGHGEVGILLSGLKALQGLLTLFLSYDIDFDQNGSYSYLDDLETLERIEDFDSLTPAQSAALKYVTELLAPNSSFLAVRPAWQARLNQVEGLMKEAVQTVRASLLYIKSKNDVDGDDLISVCKPIDDPWDDINWEDTTLIIIDEDDMNTQSPYCIEAHNIDDAVAVLDSVNKYLNQPFIIELDDIDTTLTIDFTAYFKVKDFKKFLPHYAFYPQNEWSSTKPVFHFTDGAGRNTGTVQDLVDLFDAADNDQIGAAALVDALSKIIYFQDPTFQGFLPGATQASIWNLLRKQAVHQETQDAIVTLGGEFGVMQPQFILKAATR